MRIDADLAETARRQRCPHCGGVLHSAAYERKGRPGAEKPPGWDRFHGLCCAREGCRRRVRPPSVRFLGRSPFSAALVLLVGVLATSGAMRKIAQLAKLLGVSHRTIHRWLGLWKSLTRPASAWWKLVSSQYSLSGQPIAALWKVLADLYGQDALVQAMHFCARIPNASIVFGGAGPPAKDACPHSSSVPLQVNAPLLPFLKERYDSQATP